MLGRPAAAGSGRDAVKTARDRTGSGMGRDDELKLKTGPPQATRMSMRPCRWAAGPAIVLVTVTEPVASTEGDPGSSGSGLTGDPSSYASINLTDTTLPAGMVTL